MSRSPKVDSVKTETGILLVSDHQKNGDSQAVLNNGSLESRPKSTRQGGTSTSITAAAAALDSAGLCPIDLSVLETAAIINALKYAGGNRTHAAKLLGISVRTLQRKIRDWPPEIDRMDGRQDRDRNRLLAERAAANHVNGAPPSPNGFKD